MKTLIVSLSLLFTSCAHAATVGGSVSLANAAITANAGTNLNTSALALEAGHLANIETKVSSPIPNVTTTQALSALNAALTVSTSGYPVAGVAFSGTWSGTLSMQGSIDGTNWNNVFAYNNQASIASGTFSDVYSSGSNGKNLVVKTAGYAQFRVAMTAYSSGTANVTVVQTLGEGYAFVANTVRIQDASGNGISVGQTNMSSSLPVVLASNEVVPVQLSAPTPITDVASGTINATTNGSTVTPTSGTSYSVEIPITGVAGSGATMDVEIQESRDSVNNWIPIYDFPRITATGIYYSPYLPLTADKIRYVRTIGGSGVTFTYAIKRQQHSLNPPSIRQIIDRTITLTSLNSTTVNLNADANTDNVMMTVSIGTASAAPTLQIQGSDDAGTTWYNVGAPLLAVASSAVSLTVNNVKSQLYRAIVSNAGSVVVADYVLLRAF